MIDLNLIIKIIGDNINLVSLATGIFAGETLILTLATIISSTNTSLIWRVLVFAYVGELISEFFFFFLGRTKLIHKLNKIKKFKKGFKKSEKIIDKLVNKNILMTLFYSKFTYGFRTLTVIYLGYKRIPLKKFIRAELIVMALAVSIVVTIGYLVGQGYRIALYIFRSFEIAITITLILLFFYFLLNQKYIKWLNKNG